MSDRNDKIFYGWWIIAALFITQMLAVGSTVYAFGHFVKPLSGEFDVARNTINGGLMLLLVGMGLSGPLLGHLLDRYPVRAIMLSGAALMGGGMIGIALSHSLAMMGALMLLAVAPGANAIGSLTASTLAARWFSRHRGKALGLSSVATSMGGFCIVPLIAFDIEQFGWRNALLLQGGLIIAIAGLLTLWLVHGRPQELGLQVDGDATATAAPASDAGAKQWTFAELARQPEFWQIALCVGILFGIGQALLASMVPYATDIGIGLREATLLVSALSISSVCGKLAIGAIADHVDKRWLLLAVIVCTIAQLAILIGKFDFPLLLVCCLLAGFAMGGELPLWGALVADYFGARSFGAVMGLMNPLIMVCNLGAVFAIGTAFDRLGNYDAAFMLFIGAAVLAAVLALRLQPKSAPG